MLFIVGSVESGEPGELAVPAELYGSHLAVAVFGDNALGNARFSLLGIIIFIPVQKHDDVRVLLDRTRFAQIGEHGARCV